MEFSNVTVGEIWWVFVKRFGHSLYIPFEEDLCHESAQDVPNYFTEAVPIFFLIFLIECCVKIFQGFEKPIRINDAIVSVSAGIAFEVVRVFLWGFAHFTYIGVYDKWRILELSQESFAVWCFSAIAMDFTYYWLHRAMHETSLMWATHHIHHSSEEFNVSTALRNSLTADFFAWVFWLPMAVVGIPPTHFLTHHQFNLLFQFWIHTECVDKLPWILEFVLNTPSHHRVHHASNERYLDKNYGGSLIIWDRMFGTFLEEREQPFYGTTKPVESFDPMKLQFVHYVDTWGKIRNSTSMVDKLQAFFRAPGWIPPSAIIEYKEDLEEQERTLQKVDLTKKYDPHVSPWKTIYATVHFIIVICAYQAFMYLHKGLGLTRKVGAVAFLFTSLTSIAALLENKKIAPILEMSRCAVTAVGFSFYFTFNSGSSILPLLNMLKNVFAVSAGFWFFAESIGAISRFRYDFLLFNRDGHGKEGLGKRS